MIFIEFLFFSCLGPEYTEAGCNNIHAYHLGFSVLQLFLELPSLPVSQQLVEVVTSLQLKQLNPKPPLCPS